MQTWPGGAEMQIIVASANVFRRDLSSSILNEAGYTVAEARTAAGLFTYLHDALPALIVLDYQLDDTEPSRLLRLLRQQTNVPLVWVTEQIQSMRLIASDQGRSAVLAWPYQTEQLLTVVAMLLGQVSPHLRLGIETRPYLT
ncbi:response regulator [Candidatus Viridilinea mediisalina]|uniref:Response regulatory domain-containing protein n=1 Tax=Candidatus Viridilinea mediisalina TaxID=2024553 RepID=A0A2A6RPL1_9CHLR|nr:response regulator [Candidatus Viridilinea mediisalina]PDW04809.1 hypothetical protein CJ255_01840 [Candidatus Viridilinea mediisalina]